MSAPSNEFLTSEIQSIPKRPVVKEQGSGVPESTPGGPKRQNVVLIIDES